LLFLSLLASNALLRGLVEVSLDTLDPVLAKMDFRNSVVVLHDCSKIYSIINKPNTPSKCISDRPNLASINY
jgi:hypothetical protein